MEDWLRNEKIAKVNQVCPLRTAAILLFKLEEHKVRFNLVYESGNQSEDALPLFANEDHVSVGPSFSANPYSQKRMYGRSTRVQVSSAQTRSAHFIFAPLPHFNWIVFKSTQLNFVSYNSIHFNPAHFSATLLTSTSVLFQVKSTKGTRQEHEQNRRTWREWKHRNHDGSTTRTRQEDENTAGTTRAWRDIAATCEFCVCVGPVFMMVIWNCAFVFIVQ